MPNRLQRRLSKKKARKPQSNKGESLDVPSAMISAVALHKDGEFRRAEQFYRRVLKFEPEHLDALNGLAMINYQDKDYDRALKRLRRVIDRVDDNPGYWMNLGAVQDAAGQLEDAAGAYRRSIELMPAYADPYYNLGDLYLRRKRPFEAIAVFDECLAANGRDFHALAYKAHALFDASRPQEAQHLLNFDTYIKQYEFPLPAGYDSIDSFNIELANHIQHHPTLQSNVMSTKHGKHTAELLSDNKGPMAAMETHINEAVIWYIENLPDDSEHPAVAWKPDRWKLTTWGVVMFNQGYETAHIHPNGWLSGVFYLTLPDLIDDPGSYPQGWLEFGRPTAELHVSCEPTLRRYKPEYGKIILFPSFFYHGTIPFKSKQRRICVSFDAEPIY